MTNVFECWHMCVVYFYYLALIAFFYIGRIEELVGLVDTPWYSDFCLTLFSNHLSCPAFISNVSLRKMTKLYLVAAHL